MIKSLSISLFIVLFSMTCLNLGETQETDVSTEAKETFEFDIRKLVVKAGEAILTDEGLTTIDGQEVRLLTFESKGFQFYDMEKIYVHPKTYLPIVVQRDLDIFGSIEKITEYYDVKTSSVRIVKEVKGKKTETLIEKDTPLHNIYGFLFYYRQLNNLNVGESFDLNLPTKKVTLVLKEEQLIKAAGKRQEAYYLESEPAQFKLWFAKDDILTPLRIEGAIGFGSTALVLRN